MKALLFIILLATLAATLLSSVESLSAKIGIIVVMIATLIFCDIYSRKKKGGGL